jgi:hypothetical protein
MSRHRDWFETVFGCKEKAYRAVVKLFELKPTPKGTTMSSSANGIAYMVGGFSTPSVDELAVEMTPFLSGLSQPLKVWLIQEPLSPYFHTLVSGFSYHHW